MQELSNINVIKEILSANGFTFSKSLGQNFLINPTVSVRRISCVPSSCKALVVVSSVEKSMASSKIPAFVNAFSILLFPADVYPTSAATFIPD